MELKVLTKDQWSELSEHAHRAVFGETGYAALDRCDFALLVTENDTPIAYTTLQEKDAVTVYMQWGGSFEGSKGTIKSFKAYELMMGYLKQKYQFITTNIENTNTPMLKFAMKIGFLIQGIRFFKNSILLEHLLEV